MGGVRLADPFEQELLDNSTIGQASFDDLRNMTPAVFAQLDRLPDLRVRRGFGGRASLQRRVVGSA